LPNFISLANLGDARKFAKLFGDEVCQTL